MVYYFRERQVSFVQVFISRSPQMTQEYACKLADGLRAGDVLLLQGDLGAGKTEFVKGLAAGLGVTERVTSPTFALLNVYQGKVPVYHFDLYRLERPEELAEIGFDEFLGGDGVAVVEWPDRFWEEMPQEVIKVQLAVGEDLSTRVIRLDYFGARYTGSGKGSE